MLQSKMFEKKEKICVLVRVLIVTNIGNIL